MQTHDASFPAFLYRDGPATPSIDPCDQARACGGVAWAAFKLCVRSLLIMAQIMALHGLGCALRRLSTMSQRQAGAAAFSAVMTASTAVFAAAFHLTGMIL